MPLPTLLPNNKLSLQRLSSLVCVPLTLFLYHTGYSPVYSSRVSLQIWYLNSKNWYYLLSAHIVCWALHFTEGELGSVRLCNLPKVTLYKW